MLKKCASRIYMVLIFAFLYLPIIVLIALSFNDSRSKVKWGGFTLRWYTGCFQDEKIMTAFVTTLQVTFLSAIISTLIGTLAALGIAAMKELCNQPESALKRRHIATFILLNTASIQLIPMTVSAMRLEHGAPDPWDCTLPTILTSACTLIFGLVLVRMIFAVRMVDAR